MDKLENRTVTHKGTECDVYVSRYMHGGRLAIALVERATGEPWATATVNVPDDPLGPKEVAVKDYSENEGMLDALVAAGLVRPTGRTISQGYVTIPVAEILFSEGDTDGEQPEEPK